MSRNFHSDDPATERRLNALFPILKWGNFLLPAVVYGIVWNFISFLWTYAVSNHIANTFALLTVLCAASYVAVNYLLVAVEREWDKLCPCPVCVAKRKLGGRSQ